MRNEVQNGLQILPRAALAAGQIHDECRPARGRLRPRQRRHGRLLQRRRTHHFPKPRHHFLAHPPRRLGRHIAGCDPGPAGGNDKSRTVPSRRFDRLRDAINVIRNDHDRIDLIPAPRQNLPNRRPRLIHPLAAGSRIGTGNDASANHGRDSMRSSYLNTPTNPHLRLNIKKRWPCHRTPYGVRVAKLPLWEAVEVAALSFSKHSRLRPIPD